MACVLNTTVVLCLGQGSSANVRMGEIPVKWHSNEIYHHCIICSLGKVSIIYMWLTHAESFD